MEDGDVVVEGVLELVPEGGLSAVVPESVEAFEVEDEDGVDAVAVVGEHAQDAGDVVEVGGGEAQEEVVVVEDGGDGGEAGEGVDDEPAVLGLGGVGEPRVDEVLRGDSGEL